VNINKVLLYGNLVRDPEEKALPSGIKVANFSIATSRTYKDKDGNKKETTEFHNVVAFGKQAELIAQYMKKGKGIYVDGRLQTRSWDDKATNVKKYRTEVIVENFQFGPNPTGQGGGTYTPSQTEGGPASMQGGAKSATDKSAKIDTIEYPTEEINPEDIPF
jgi:single-strand DNA-binding protein